jgi:hypothetical protein
VVIDVDLAAQPPAVTLTDPADCERFSVRRTGPGALAEALEGAGVGRMDGDDALVEVDAVRRLAAGRVDEAWEGRFAAMLDYAATKGWLTDDGRAIRAHVAEA